MPKARKEPGPKMKASRGKDNGNSPQISHHFPELSASARKSRTADPAAAMEIHPAREIPPPHCPAAGPEAPPPDTEMRYREERLQRVMLLSERLMKVEKQHNKVMVMIYALTLMLFIILLLNSFPKACSFQAILGNFKGTIQKEAAGSPASAAPHAAR